MRRRRSRIVRSRDARPRPSTSSVPFCCRQVAGRACSAVLSFRVRRRDYYIIIINIHKPNKSFISIFEIFIIRSRSVVIDIGFLSPPRVFRPLKIIIIIIVEFFFFPQFVRRSVRRAPDAGRTGIVIILLLFILFFSFRQTKSTEIRRVIFPFKNCSLCCVLINNDKKLKSSPAVFFYYYSTRRRPGK